MPTTNDTTEAKDKSAIVAAYLKEQKRRMSDDGALAVATASELDAAMTSGSFPVLPTGIIGVDLNLGAGGFPQGAITELFGPLSSGKTSLALAAAAQVQANGGHVLFIDAECALNVKWAVPTFGLDMDTLIVARPTTGNEAFQMAFDAAETRAFDLIIIDSVAALVPDTVYEKDFGDANQLGMHAKMMSDGVKKLVGVLKRTDTAAVFINQIRLNPGAGMYENPEYRPGGQALGFYASLAIDVRCTRSKKTLIFGPKIDGEESVIGQVCKVKVVKSKIGPTHGTTSYDLYHTSGPGIARTLYHAAVKTGVIEKPGAGKHIEAATGEQLARSEDKMIEILAEDPVIAKRLLLATYEATGFPQAASVLAALDAEIAELEALSAATEEAVAGEAEDTELAEA